MRIVVGASVVLCLAGVFALACRKSSVVAPPIDGGVAVPSTHVSASVPPPSASATSPDSMASAPTTIASDAAADDAPVTASEVAGFAGGGVLVYARSADDAPGKSDIFARVLDADGRMRAPARLLRRTSGTVADLGVSIRDEAVWVAWASSLDEKILAAVVKTDRKLDTVSSPITVVHEGFGSSSPNHWVRLLAVPNGGAVVVTRGTAVPITCMFQAQHPNERCTAGTYVVTHIARDGSMTPLAKRPLDGNPIEAAPLVDIGGAVVVRAYAWHGGGISDDQVIAYADEGKGKQLALGSCRPGYEQAFTGEELVTLCALDYLDKGEKCPVKLDADMCPRIHRTKVEASPSDAGKRHGVIAKKIENACADGHPVVRVTEGDGSALVIDPTKPGASIPQLAGWTGKVLLETAHDGDGPNPLVVKRRACRGTALVELPP